MSSMDPEVVGQRLRRGAALFRFMDREQARCAMEGRLPGEHALEVEPADFAVAVARRLEILRQLDRRRRALAG